MRKIVAALAVMAIVAAPAAAGPYVEAEVNQGAAAFWTRSVTKKLSTFLFAAGAHIPTPDGVQTFGMVGSGSCVRRKPTSRVQDCIAAGIIKFLPMENVEVDPLLRTATMKMRALGRIHRVTWVGDSAPEPVPDGGAGAGGVEGSFTVIRPGTASGSVFGTKVRPGKGVAVDAVIAQGAWAGAFLEAIRITHLTGNRYRFEIAIPG